MAFLKYGNIYKVASRESLDLHDVLPPQNFVVKFDRNNNLYYLERIDSFENPKSKIFGDIEAKRDRIYNTFIHREQSTGILLVGEKGSGKSLLAKLLSIKAAGNDIPTIVINSDFYGDVFNAFMQGITQPAVVIFDEFEKIYSTDKNNENPQEQILTLLDGVYPSKKLFILTCNNDRLNYALQNRPGRIYYRIDFSGIEESFVKEYCSEKLNNKDFVDRIVTITRAYSNFNFDMLQALVEEMNRYNETPDEVLKMLNIRANTAGYLTYSYSVQIFINKKQVKQSDLINPIWSGNLFSDNFYIRTNIDGVEKYHEFCFENIVDIDLNVHQYVFENNGKRLILNRLPEERKSLLSLI